MSGAPEGPEDAAGPSQRSITPPTASPTTPALPNYVTLKHSFLWSRNWPCDVQRPWQMMEQRRC